MQIKSSVYEKLSHRERIIASVEAKARGDEAEVRRLVQTCPKVNYTCSDKAYSSTMEALMDVSVYIECELRGFALGYSQIMLWAGDGMLEEGEYEDAARNHLQHYAVVREAWKRHLASYGIDEDTMIAASPFNTDWREKYNHLSPTPNEERVASYVKQMEEYFE